MAKYSKSIAAFIGLAALLSKEIFGVEVGQETTDHIVNAILGIGTVVAVYGVRNK